MTDAKDAQSTEAGLPSHVADTVQAIAGLHAAHADEASPAQERVERATRRIGTPAFIALFTFVVVSGVSANLALVWAGREPLDEPPFFWLQGAIALSAFYMTVLIL